MTTQNPTRAKPFEAASGPWSNLSTVYSSQMDAAFKAAEPALQAVARVQMEYVHLAAARSRAWAAIPGDISRCRGPADFATLQLNFWQEAQRAYAQGWQRILSASSALAAQGRDAAPTAPRRDVLSVSDPAPDERKRHAA
jgi:hypothetical protein